MGNPWAAAVQEGLEVEGHLLGTGEPTAFYLDILIEIKAAG